MKLNKYSVRKFRFRTTLVFLFILQVVLAIGMTSYLYFQSGQKAIGDLATQLRSELVARIDGELRRYLGNSHNFNQLNAIALAEGRFDLINASNVKQLLIQVRVSPFVYSSYCGDAQGYYIGANRVLDQGSPIIAMSASNGETDHRFYFYRIDDQGNRQKIFQQLKPYDPRQRPWYIAAIKQKKATWGEVYLGFSSGLPTITASEPVYDVQGKLLGVCATDVVLLKDLRKFLGSLSIGKRGNAFIIDHFGYILSSSSQEPLTVGTGENIKLALAIQSEEPVIRETAKNIQKQFGSFNQIQRSQQLDYLFQGERWLAQVSPLQDDKGLDWLIVIVIPEANFMAQIYENNRRTIILILITLILAIFIGIRASYWITNPLHRLAQASEGIAKGNLEQYVDSSNIIEIDTLSQSFNRMSEKLKKLIKALSVAKEELEHRVEQRTAQLNQEKEHSEQLLLNILPAEIVERLKRAESPTEYFEEVTILFADIVGFTQLSSEIEPMQLVAGLNRIFSAFDGLTEKYGLEKIKTIGDAYMVVGGLPTPRSDHATAIADMALDMQAYMQTVKTELGENLELRIGINTGPVIAGVIGIKKFIYDLWGDAVNVASRMESHGKPGYIQVTEATYSYLKDQYILERRGPVFVKGRGEMLTYWLIGKD